MIISEERQRHFAHILIDGLWGDELIDFDEDQEEEIIRRTKRAIAEWVQTQGDIDGSVRAKIATLKRSLIEGTNEWNILYKKYYNEEVHRRGYK